MALQKYKYGNGSIFEAEVGSELERQLILNGATILNENKTYTSNISNVKKENTVITQVEE